MAECIDLERKFGSRFKVGYEDPSMVATQDPWHKVIVCKSGNISPAGGTKLWACVNGRRNRAALAIRRGEVPCVIKMDGDDGMNAEFDVADYKVFFTLMGAKER